MLSMETVGLRRFKELAQKIVELAQNLEDSNQKSESSMPTKEDLSDILPKTIKAKEQLNEHLAKVYYNACHLARFGQPAPEGNHVVQNISYDNYEAHVNNAGPLNSPKEKDFLLSLVPEQSWLCKAIGSNSPNETWVDLMKPYSLKESKTASNKMPPMNNNNNGNDVAFSKLTLDESLVVASNVVRPDKSVENSGDVLRILNAFRSLHYHCNVQSTSAREQQQYPRGFADTMLNHMNIQAHIHDAIYACNEFLANSYKQLNEQSLVTERFNLCCSALIDVQKAVAELSALSMLHFEHENLKFINEEQRRSAEHLEAIIRKLEDKISIADSRIKYHCQVSKKQESTKQEQQCMESNFGGNYASTALLGNAHSSRVPCSRELSYDYSPNPVNTSTPKKLYQVNHVENQMNLNNLAFYHNNNNNNNYPNWPLNHPHVELNQSTGTSNPIRFIGE